MNRAMVDAHVLIYAVRSVRKKDRADLQSKCAASFALLRPLQTIRISAIAWLEVLRGLKPEEQERFSQLRDHVKIAAVDASTVDRAAALLRARNQAEKLCRKCLSAEKDRSCPACKRLVAAHQRVNDALIAATADVLTDVDVLYSYDTGVQAFGAHLHSCRIETPPDPNGPLFERVRPSDE